MSFRQIATASIGFILVGRASTLVDFVPHTAGSLIPTNATRLSDPSGPTGKSIISGGGAFTATNSPIPAVIGTGIGVQFSWRSVQAENLPYEVIGERRYQARDKGILSSRHCGFAVAATRKRIQFNRQRISSFRVRGTNVLPAER